MNIVIRKRRAIDTTAPTISSIVGVPGGVTWTTNEPATSQVDYGGGGSVYSTLVADDGAIAYWRLGEPSGTSAAEEIGTATGTYTNTPTLGATSLLPGDSDTAVTFAAASAEYVAITANMPAGSATGTTFEMWVKPTADLAIGDYHLLSWAAIGTGAHHLLSYRRYDATNWGFAWYFSNGAAQEVTAWIDSADRIDDGSAHHLMVVHDYVLKTLTVYADGASIGSVDLGAYGTVGAIASSSSVRIGGYIGNTLSTFDGTLDEVAIYDLALSSSDAATHAATSGGGSGYLYTASDATLVTSHTLTIPALTAGMHYIVKSADASGNLATSADQTVAAGSGTMQERIDAAAAGSTVYLTGVSSAGPIYVTKALTLIGGTVTVASSASGVYISASNVTIDGMTVTGSQDTVLDADEYGIFANGSSGSWLTNITVQNCTVDELGFCGILLQYVDGFSVYNNTVTDIKYAGIRGRPVRNGTINWNTVSRIDYSGGAAGDNAYGIAVEDFAVVGTHCYNVVIADNIVEDNPWWEGLDTHAGEDIQFLRNICRRCSVNLEITKHDSGGDRPKNITVTGNVFSEPTTYRAQGGHPVVIYGCDRAVFANNTYTGFGAESPPATAPWYDYTSNSTNLIDGGGNVVTP